MSFHYFSEEYFPSLLASIPIEVDYATGCTKAVIWTEDMEYVIKIPFVGDEEGVFSGSFYTKEGWDYCAEEVERYKLACRYNLNDFFLETVFVDKINDYPIYAQKRVCIFGDQNFYSSHSQEQRQSVTSKLRDKKIWVALPIDWLIDAQLYYGEERVDDLLSFLKDFDFQDLHSGNVGYLNGKPIIVDYAGFNG